LQLPLFLIINLSHSIKEEGNTGLWWFGKRCATHVDFTNSLKQDPWEANGSWGSHVLGSPKDRYCVQKSSPLPLVPSHMNPFHTLLPYLISLLISPHHTHLGLPNGLCLSCFSMYSPEVKDQDICLQSQSCNVVMDYKYDFWVWLTGSWFIFLLFLY
jgi:hypothetical protein